METQFDAFMSFPADEYTEQTFDRLFDLLQRPIEGLEDDFDIDFSCGDGKFFTDFWKWTENGEALIACASCEEMEKYDGKICLKSPPRFRDTKELFKTNKDYRFTVKTYGEDGNEEVRFYINGKERSRRDID